MNSTVHRNFHLDAIDVRTPCPADWNKMTGDDRVRFCGQCKLNVYNFSEMTRVQIEELILEKEGRLCARFYRRDDGTILTKNCSPVRVRRARRALALVMGFSLLFATQGLAAFLGAERKQWIIRPEFFSRLRQSRVAKNKTVVKTIAWVETSLFPPKAVLPLASPVLPASASVVQGFVIYE